MRCFVLLLFLAILIGCAEDDLVGPVASKTTPEYLGDDVDETSFARFDGIGDTLAVDSGFVLTFGETPYDSVQATHRQFLHLRTVEWYFCYNQFIIAHVETHRRRITVDIEGVQIPSYFFLDGFKQSDVTEYFKLEPAQYDIEIRYRQDTGRFDLKVTDTSLEVTAVSAGIFALPESLYWRFRPNSCCYYCKGYLDTTACASMLDTVLGVVALTEYQYPDYGVRPYPNGSSTSYVDWGAHYFTYDSTADFDRAGEAFMAYARAHWPSQSANLAYLMDYRGKRYLSWIQR